LSFSFSPTAEVSSLPIGKFNQFRVTFSSAVDSYPGAFFHFVWSSPPSLSLSLSLSSLPPGCSGH
jgi:hypothetical protein